MVKSLTVQAIDELNASIQATQIASQGVVDPPDGSEITTDSAIIIPATSTPRLVAIANFGIQHSFLAIGMDAVAEKGICLLMDHFQIVPLGANRALHAITKQATTSLGWQSFG